ncbi:MAG: PIN domain-containing protein [Candidatus Micrarchaeota archaeon]
MAIELVIDANILFSATLTDGMSRRLILDPRLKLYAPAYLFAEFTEHVQHDAEFSGKLPQNEETLMIMERFRQAIEVIPLVEFEGKLHETLKDCADPFDAPYIALADLRRIPLWSNDKRLKRQAGVKVLNTQEILKLLEQET